MPTPDYLFVFSKIYKNSIDVSPRLCHYFTVAQQPQWVKASSDKPHSVGILWVSDQPDTETST